MHRRRQVGQETARAGKSLFLGLDGFVDRTAAGLDVGTAQRLLGIK